MATAVQSAIHQARRKLNIHLMLHGIVNKGARNLGGYATAAAFLATEKELILAALRPIAHLLLSMYGHILPLVKEEVGDVRKLVEENRNNYTADELKNQFAVLDEMPEFLQSIFMSVLGSQKVQVLRNVKNGNRDFHGLKCDKAKELIDKKLAKKEPETTLKEAYELELSPSKCCSGPKDGSPEAGADTAPAKEVDPRLAQIHDDAHQGYIGRRATRLSMAQHVTERKQTPKLGLMHLLLKPWRYWMDSEPETTEAASTTTPSTPTGTTLGSN